MTRDQDRGNYARACAPRASAECRAVPLGAHAAHWGKVPVGIALDPEIARSAIALRVFIFIASRADGTTGRAPFSDDEKHRVNPTDIIEALGIHKQRLSEAVELLTRRGALTLIRRPARDDVYHVNFAFDVTPAGADLSSATPEPSSATPELFADISSGTAEPHNISQTLESDTQTGARSSQEEGSERELRLMRPIGRRPRPADAGVSPARVQEAFDEFWAVYPPSDHKHAPHLCAVKFQEIVEMGGATIDELLAAVHRFALQPPEPRFVAQPIKWLEEERWKSMRAAWQPRAGIC